MNFAYDIGGTGVWAGMFPFVDNVRSSRFLRWDQIPRTSHDHWRLNVESVLSTNVCKSRIEIMLAPLLASIENHCFR